MLRASHSRRPAGLEPGDFDHEISLVDRDAARTPTDPVPADNAALTRSSTTSQLLRPGRDDQAEAAPNLGVADGQGGGNGHAHGDHVPPQGPIVNSPDGQNDQHDGEQPSLGPSIQVQGPSPSGEAANGQPRQRPRKPSVKRETAIDILYENERGGFFCGIALFASKALGFLDPPPWTNAYHKASPTSIHTAQVPDPSWEWIWPEWRVNHQEGTDEGGWEYSFAFGKFSWHGPQWWNSCVRRRAWTRKRAKRLDHESADLHMLHADYFQVLPASERKSLARASVISSKASGTSLSQASALDEGLQIGDIETIDSLLQILRRARIDREKLEAIESYLANASDMGKLEGHMHEIMSLFVFQAARRAMLSRLIQIYDETGDKMEKMDTPELQSQRMALQKAVKHAAEEVRRLAYWSDVKKMTKAGEAQGAVDSQKGWDEEWQGVDQSGPAPPRVPPSTNKNQHRNQ